MGYGPVRTWARWDYLDDDIRRCKRRQIDADGVGGTYSGAHAEARPTAPTLVAVRRLTSDCFPSCARFRPERSLTSWPRPTGREAKRTETGSHRRHGLNQV
jgi:hypothetical protein